MKLALLLMSILILGSCASKKEVVQGHEKLDIEKRRSQLIGKTSREIVKILGTPAIQGECRACGKKGIYKIIYLKKDMAKFYYNISLNTDMEVECTVLELTRNRQNKFVFRKNSPISVMKNCNQADGEIMKLKKTLDEQDAADALKAKSKR